MPDDKPTEFDPTLMSLFKVELENQSSIISNALLTLEQTGETPETFVTLLRAIHSIKGASRVVNLGVIVTLTHHAEEVVSRAKKKQILFDDKAIETLFKVVDFLTTLAKQPQATTLPWLDQEAEGINALVKQLDALVKAPPVPAKIIESAKQEAAEEVLPSEKTAAEVSHERILRVTAESLNRLMGLAGEAMVESRWLQPFSDSMARLKKNLSTITYQIEGLKNAINKSESMQQLLYLLKFVEKKNEECQQNLANRLSDLDIFINRNSTLFDRLYHEAIDSRMRPFGDLAKGFPRMVRDIAHEQNKKVRIEITGKWTPVDRDILEALETPLAHLLRNAVAHGIEAPEEREKTGKKPEGTILLEAEHRAGMLSITVSDDGKGLDPEEIRRTVIERGLVSQSIAEKLSDAELIDFLFLPGFTTTSEVSEISGRGVGLNAVLNMAQAVGGSIQTSYTAGQGTQFNLQLPLTLAVLRALIVEIAKEPYAIPLNRLVRITTVPQEKVEYIENRQFFHHEGKNIGLISGAQILGFEERRHGEAQLPIVIISSYPHSYGIVVDAVLEEKELVLHEIDPRLGKVRDVLSGAFLEDGSPILILDVEDMVRTIDNILSTGMPSALAQAVEEEQPPAKKRILVIDDSITVREIECRLLRNRGYEVEAAVNGMEGWNALRMGHFDLVVTDVDMPRMNGIELVKAIKADPRLKSLPVMIVSYKEREDDRIKGLEAGANYYLTKGSFHDQALINAVVDLIGEA